MNRNKQLFEQCLGELMSANLGQQKRLTLISNKIFQVSVDINREENILIGQHDIILR